LYYLAEKKGEPTKYNVFRQAVDRAIQGAMTERQFGNILRAQGFEMKMSGKYWTIKMIGDSRAIRLYRLGEDYDGNAITRRILENSYTKIIPYQKLKPTIRTAKLIGSFTQVKKITGLRALYFYYLYRMGVLPKNKLRPPSHPILWEDVRQLRKYTGQIRLLGRNKIDTFEQLRTFVDTTQSRIDELIQQRTYIQNKLRRAKEPEVIESLKVEKAALTEHITPLRRDLRIAAEIEERSARMKEKLAVIRNLELREKSKLHQLKHKGDKTYARAR
jgi:hypothetical protein